MPHSSNMLLVAVAGFLLSYLATLEIVACAKGWRGVATVIAAFRAGMSFLCTYVIVVDEQRLWLLPAYVVGDAFGTWLAMTKAGGDDN